MMSDAHRAMVLDKLADLCDEYNISFGYTTDDDGIHIDIDGKDVYAGFDFSNDLRITARELRSNHPQSSQA